MTPAELRAIRRQLGLTQTELAERIGVHLRSVQKWEGSEREISRPVAMLIEAIFRQARPRRRKVSS